MDPKKSIKNDSKEEWKQVVKNSYRAISGIDRSVYAVRYSAENKKNGLTKVGILIDKSILDKMAFDPKSDRALIFTNPNNPLHFKIKKSKDPINFKITASGKNGYRILFSVTDKLKGSSSYYVKFEQKKDELLIYADQPI